MVGIYKVTNRVNGNFYIGQSNNIKRRFVEHKNLNKRGCRLLHAALKKYGVENFSFEVVEECREDELDKREIYYIETLMPAYNIAAGGKGKRGVHVSDEVKEVLRKHAKEQWANRTEEQKNEIIKHNLVGPRKGHEVSEHTRELLRNHNLGKKQSDETVKKRQETMRKKKEAGWKKDGSKTWKPVICIETGEVFQSVKESAERFGIRPAAVSSVLCRRRKTAGGYHFEYAKV